MLLSKIKMVSVLVIGFCACLASAGIIGNQNVGSSSSTTARRAAQRFAVGENGNITSITVYHAGTGTKLIAAVYTDNNSAPGTLISRSSIQNATTAAGWQTVTLAAAAPVSAGTYVWLAWFFQTSPGTRYVSGSGYKYGSEAWPSGATPEILMPSSFAAATSMSRLFSIYAEYTPGGTIPPPTEYWTKNNNDIFYTSGKVGIGVNTPSYFLSVKNDASQNQAIFGQGKTSGDAQICIGEADAPTKALNLGYRHYGTSGYGYLQIAGVDIGSGMVFDDVGRIGIGLHQPTEKLEVAGNIKCQKVLINDWTIEAPDYVFNKDYKLPSLKEVEEHITAEKHLPDVPSASEMKKSGVDLSEMNMTLLKKVEELTLYVIEQNKKIEALERNVSDK